MGDGGLIGTVGIVRGGATTLGEVVTTTTTEVRVWASVVAFVEVMIVVVGGRVTVDGAMVDGDGDACGCC